MDVLPLYREPEGLPGPRGSPLAWTAQRQRRVHSYDAILRRLFILCTGASGRMLLAGSVGAEGGVPGREVHFFSHEGNTGGSEPKGQWAVRMPPMKE